MKTLRILLKLFPTSFQNEMGEAWLEASETEIRQRQNAEGKKFSIVVAFAMETIFTVLPQAYNLKQSEIAPSPQDFVPEKNKTIAQIVNFFNTWAIFHCGGMIVALYIVGASVFLPAAKVWIYWAICAFLVISTSYKSIHCWWIRNDKPIVSIISGSVVGFFSTFLIIIIIFFPAQIEATAGHFAMYDELKEKIGYDSENPTNEWFEQTQDNVRVRPERKEQWCALSRARLDGAATALQAGQDNAISGMLISTLLSNTYFQGCWDNEEMYIADRHKIAARSTISPQSERLFATVDWVIGFKDLKEAQRIMRTRSLYSPQKYCLEYTAKNYYDTTGKFLKDIDLWNFCEKVRQNQSMTMEQARTVRENSDKYIQKMEVL